jgi:hypothetical protein
MWQAFGRAVENKKGGGSPIALSAFLRFLVFRPPVRPSLYSLFAAPFIVC